MPDTIFSVLLLLWPDNRQTGHIHLLRHTQASNSICC